MNRGIVLAFTNPKPKRQPRRGVSRDSSFIQTMRQLERVSPNHARVLEKLGGQMIDGAVVICDSKGGA